MQVTEHTIQLRNVSQGTFQTKELSNRWDINGYSVRLFKSGKEISYETSKKETGQLILSSIIPYTGSQNRIIQALRNRHPVFKDNGQVTFCEVVKKWQFPAVTLIKKDKILMWSIANAGKEILQPFSQGTVPSSRCHIETVRTLHEMTTHDSLELERILQRDFIVTKIFDSHEYESERKERKKFKLDTYRKIRKQEKDYGDFRMHVPSLLVIPAIAFSMTPVSFGVLLAGAFILSSDLIFKSFNKTRISEETLLTPEKTKVPSAFCVEIEPISVESYIDSRCRVSKFTWAVTLMAGPKGKLGNHISILIEGIASRALSVNVPEGEHFLLRAHFTPPTKTKLVTKKKFDEWKFEKIQRSQIWMKSSKKVEAMIRCIAQERDEHADIIARGIEVPLAKKGEDSIFGDGTHSCITWAREKLKMIDVVLDKCLTGKLITVSKLYTEPLEYYDSLPAIVQI